MVKAKQEILALTVGALISGLFLLFAISPKDQTPMFTLEPTYVAMGCNHTLEYCTVRL